MEKIIIANMPCHNWEGEPYKSTLWTWRRSGSRWSHSIPNSLGGYHQYPFMIGYATSYLLKHEIDVMMLDSIAARHTYSQFFNVVERIEPTIFIIETSAGTYQNDLNIASKLSQHYGIKIALTGNYATVNYRQILIDNNWITSILRGEYEFNSLQLIKDAENNNIQKVYDYNICCLILIVMII